MDNETQSYANHVRLHPLYHFVTVPLVLGLLISATVHVIQAIQNDSNVFSAILILVISVLFNVMLLIIRPYPLKIQDRVIRAEENLRHYVLAQKLLDPKLSMKQIIALRFASDAEFVSLCQRAVKENLSPKEIKQAVKQWKGDFYRL